jgi:hypothetical protein
VSCCYCNFPAVQAKTIGESIFVGEIFQITVKNFLRQKEKGAQGIFDSHKQAKTQCSSTYAMTQLE